MKRKYVVIGILIMLVTVILSGCSVKKLSGTYVNENNNKEYFKFSGESTVELYTDEGNVTGTYSIVDDVVMLMFSSGEKTAMQFLAIKDKNTLVYNIVGPTYVKRTFWNYYWKRILLFGTIGFVVLGIIGNIIDRRERNNAKSAVNKGGLKAVGKELAKSAAEDLNEIIDDFKKDMKD